MAVEFNEPSYARSAPATKKPSWLSAFVIKTGLAKDAAGAQRVLLVVLAVVVLATAAVVWIGSANSAAPAQPLPDELIP